MSRLLQPARICDCLIIRLGILGTRIGFSALMADVPVGSRATRKLPGGPACHRNSYRYLPITLLPPNGTRTLYSSNVSHTLSAITAGLSPRANVPVRSNPCGPVMRTRNPPLNESAAIHASCGAVVAGGQHPTGAARAREP